MEENLNSQIKQLWIAGLSSGEIAKDLGVTRNVVMGRVHRMRDNKEISIRECDERVYQIKKEVRRLENERQASLPDIIKVLPLEKEQPMPPKKEEPQATDILRIFDPPQPEKPKRGPIKFNQLTYMTCRFIINDGDPKDFLFCGAPKKGRAYCAEHEAICYYKIERKGKR
jgi:hypothetical protein